MDNLTIAAASGMRSRLETLDLLANNIANSATAGYKADREFYNLYLSPEASGTSSTLPVIEQQWTDFSQGTLQSTGNALDVALSGKGFFVVDSPQGPLLTRNGSFTADASGLLKTSEGYAVRGADGKPLQVDPRAAVEIQEDGTIRQNGAAAGRIAVVDPDEALAKAGSSYFRLSNLEGLKKNAAAAKVLQGRLEAANTSPAEMSIRLINVMRQFEMLQRAVGLNGEMGRKAIEEVAKVNQ